MRKLIPIAMVFFLMHAGCSRAANEEDQSLPQRQRGEEVATFSGGRHWALEAAFEPLDGVREVVSGYITDKNKGGNAPLSTDKTVKLEAVQVYFNPAVISYSELLDIFWQQIDPTDATGSFNDRGSQYRSAIFYHSLRQKEIANASKHALGNSGKFNAALATPIEKFQEFAKAVDQDYYKNNPEQYREFLKASGRQENRQVRGYSAPDKATLRKTLSQLQYRVTMEDATEPAFNNAYDKNDQAGIYVCVVSGAPLFSSRDKFDSKTGWPSFTKPIDARLLEKPVDTSYGMMRVEVRSKYGKSHVGHVFNDGPNPTNLRYCMNSAAMRFVPKDSMRHQGYSEYLWMVE